MNPTTAMSSLTDWVTRLADATPTPSPSPMVTEDMVTPGVIGFLATFFIAAATVLLVVDMSRRVRRVRYRAEVQEQLDAEEREAGGGTKATPKSQAPETPGATPAPED